MAAIYSKWIVAQIKQAEIRAKDILSSEMNLKVHRSRFEYNNYLYPIHIVAFENSQRLGSFNPDLLEIGINKELFNQGYEQLLLDTLRHELAHFITFLRHGHTDKSHGIEFKTVCKSFGYKKEVYLSTAKLEKKASPPSNLVKKVKKLMALSQSDEVHEASLATLKANELILKYHISNTDDEYLVSRVLEAKRSSAKIEAICLILQNFLVRPVLNQGKSKIYLEVFGSKEHVEIAKYVASFLDHELEVLWLKTEHTGIRSKNSFMRGIAKGYTEKLKPIIDTLSKELVIANSQLDEKLPMAYPHLRRNIKRVKECKEASKSGQSAGRSLKIREGITKKTSSLLLT